MNKKGDMSLTTVITGIILLIVLLVVVFFFTGTFNTIGKKLGFISGTLGDDLSITVQACQNYCETAKNLPNPLERIKSMPFCTKPFAIDKNNDGKVEEDELTIKCTEPPISAKCMIPDINGIEKEAIC
ncbi:hypothetical protein J4403_00375 [Candidatus Woesearchaeota archaeon]|nr:hypothetical protein [Candidatus Woesearchaeota archaeon]